MESKLSITATAREPRNVISDDSELRPNSQVNLRRWKIGILRTIKRIILLTFVRSKKMKVGVNKIDKNSIEKIKN